MAQCGNEAEVRFESVNVEVSEYGISMEGSRNEDTGSKEESGSLAVRANSALSAVV